MKLHGLSWITYLIIVENWFMILWTVVAIFNLSSRGRFNKTVIHFIYILFVNILWIYINHRSDVRTIVFDLIIHNFFKILQLQTLVVGDFRQAAFCVSFVMNTVKFLGRDVAIYQLSVHIFCFQFSHQIWTFIITFHIILIFWWWFSFFHFVCQVYCMVQGIWWHAD